jgi:hypothetical protein
MADLINTLNYSVSREETLKYCARKYYISYYESWNGWLAAAPERTQLAYFLKKRDTAAIWIGHHIHSAIKSIIQNIDRSELGHAIEILKAKLSEDFIKSKNRTKSNGKVKDLWLYEHYKGEILDYNRIEERAVHLLTNFFESHIYKALKAKYGSYKILYLDSDDFDQMKFEFNGFTVFAIPDLCYQKDDGSVAIWDWKTGKSGEEDLSKQLKTYALRLMVSNGINPAATKVEGYSYFLDDLTMNGNIINMDDIESIKTSISKGFNDMQDLLEDVPSNAPKQEDYFPKTQHTNKCKGCVFNEMCW